MSDKNFNLQWDDQEKQILDSEKVIDNKQQDLSNALKNEETKEQKESIEQVRKLEKEDHTIDSSSREEKILLDDNNEYVEWKLNPNWDICGIVMDCYDHVNSKCWDMKWVSKEKQLFTYEAAKREAKKLWKKLPASAKVYKDIIDKKYSWRYWDFMEWEGVVLPGIFNSDTGKLKELTNDEEVGYWCEDGSVLMIHAEWSAIYMDDYSKYKNVGLSLRFLEWWKESISLENLPKLEEENFKIDSTDWEEIEGWNWIKVNPEWDVREYLEWKQKWEQLFTKASALRETKKAGKTLPSSWKVLEDIIKKKYKWNYQDFLEKENIKFSGWRTKFPEIFKHIDEVSHMWCEDGSSLIGFRDRWHHNNHHDNYGLSVRCIQD